ncbi:MAG: hypothetical protein FP833_10920 [Atribacteria sp.]|nr:hypothetical protein [Candidatus Atribacteria bacterium]MCG2830913.1 zinc ribbon domain-containing protein [Desulfobacteraceae bacterium]
MAERIQVKGAFRCPRCGQVTSGAMKSCPECGQKLTLECSECGQTWRHVHGYKFCPNCGKRVSEK